MKLKTKIVLLISLVIVSGTAAMGGFSIYTLQSKLSGVVPAGTYNAIASSFRNSIILFGVIGLVLAIVASWFVAELNARPLIRLIEVAKRVATGDLQVEKLATHRVDEIGQLSVAMNGMVENLHSLIAGVNRASTQVAQASDDLAASTDSSVQTSEQITRTIQQVASGAEEQLQAAQATERAIQEMAQGIAQVAETAVVVTEAALETAQEAEQGNGSIQRAIEQMALMHATVDQSAVGIKALEGRSQEVGKIVEVITGIAAQTNLLALNAAIEAARAGEHGKGFSVVADEVRKLAEQAGESAGQIAALIEAIQAEVVHAVRAMDEVIGEVQDGTQAVNVASSAFERIYASAKQVSLKIQDVSASSQEMSAGSQLVIQTVGTVTQIAEASETGARLVAASAEQQMATMEGLSISAESLSKMAHELQQIVAKFRV